MGKEKRENNKSSEPDPFWLAHRDRRNRTHFWRRPSRREQHREELMRDWFGPDLARGEILSRKLPACPLADPLDQLLREFGRGHQVVLEQIREKWSELVGSDIARQTQPVGLRQQCLEIEVSNSMWLYELETRMKPQLTERLAGFSDQQVRTLRLVPAGRRRAGQAPG